jgi:hypothetical protein
MEKLNAVDDFKFADCLRKTNNAEDGGIVDSVKPKTEVNIKTEEVAFCMTQGDLKAFTSKLEKNPCDKESAEIKAEKKCEPLHTFLTELTDEFREEVLERVCEIKREEKQLEKQL